MATPWDEAYNAGRQYARMVREEGYPALSDTMLGFMMVDVFPDETKQRRTVHKEAYRQGYNETCSGERDR